MVQAVGKNLPHNLTIWKTWFDVTVTQFGTGTGTLQRWPFDTTQIQQSDGIPTDSGLLDPEDLGDVIDVLDEPSLSSLRDKSTASRDISLGKPKFGEVRSRKFRLDVPADFRALLWCWYTEGMLVAKNEAIRIVNDITDHNRLHER